VSETLAELFSSKVRAAVLAHLLPRPHLAFGLTDLSRLLGLPVSSLQHECYKLTRIGVLKDAREGPVRRYRPHPGFPLLAPLTALILRDLGWERGLQAAAEGDERIDLAFVARPAHRPRSATLVVVGLLDLETLDALGARVAAVFAAHGAPAPELAFLPPIEWRTRTTEGDPLVRSLLAAPRVPLVDPGGSATRAPERERADAPDHR